MIPIAKPLIGQPEADAAAEAVLSGWLSQGEQVAAFEAEFAVLVGAPYACAVSNCTTALHLALLALGLGAGDEVVTVSSSFIATANVVRQCGATPVFVDIEHSSFNIDPDRVADALTPRTKAILCVHQLGMPCDLARILPVAHEAGVPVLEDAACALGSRVRMAGVWEPIGRPCGDIACFSFHPRKVATTGEGGMLTTRNPEWDRLFRLWRQHGMSVPDLARHRSGRVLFETYETSGYNYRMTDVQAAIGRCQLRRLPAMLEIRRALAARYNDLLQDVEGLQPPEEPAWAETNWQSYCVRLPPDADQRLVMQRMLDLGVATRRGVMCAHLEPAYAGHSPGLRLPHSEQARDQCLMLPLFPQMTDTVQDEVIAALRAALPRTARVTARRAARVQAEAPPGLPG
jgi:dTDP-4-amino-4,6-dideoxygalactose transaminase